ncbi:hypothetical protein LCGC14_1076830 [marine sediment metagenome]|uniref:Uncharacterized protein n=1 Tax=marine sediment metagenome TaxID=412755 RepID=A0A0F9PZN7_9ZZZZ
MSWFLKVYQFTTSAITNLTHPPGLLASLIEIDQTAFIYPIQKKIIDIKLNHQNLKL